MEYCYQDDQTANPDFKVEGSATTHFYPKPYKKVHTIFTLGEIGYSLRKAIDFYIESEDNHYVGFFKPLDIYCYGDTPLEVENGLKIDILDLCDHLTSTPNNKLGEKPKFLKLELLKLIERTDAP